MRDIIPPKNFKQKTVPVKILKKEEENIILEQKASRKSSRGFLVLFVILFLLSLGAAGVYVFYINPDALKIFNPPKVEQTTTEQKDAKLGEIEKSLTDIEESVQKFDEEDNSLESPTFDLNISF